MGNVTPDIQKLCTHLNERLDFKVIGHICIPKIKQELKPSVEAK